MTINDLRIYEQCHAGDCRSFFTINERYSGYISRDQQTYFVLDKETNAYKDFSRNELITFLANLETAGRDLVRTFNENAKDFFNAPIEMFDSDKIKTGLILLAVLAAGFFVIKKL